MRPDSAASPHSASSHSFPRAKRLTRGPEIEQVRKEGKRMRTGSLDVRVAASLRASPRMGIIVPRYGHSAVARNQLKRRLRELIRVEVLPTLPPIDVVWRTAPRAYEREFLELRDEVRKIARQLLALPPTEPPRASVP